MRRVGLEELCGDRGLRARLYASGPLGGSMDFYWSLVLAWPVARVRRERECVARSGGVR